MKKSIIGMTLLGVGFLAVSSYTSVSINSDAFMNDNEIKFVKRLDELNGNVVRSVASIRPMNFSFGGSSAPVPAMKKFQKPEKRNLITRVKDFFKGDDNNDAPKVKAAIMQELDLTLTEVYSPKKYNIPLTKEQFEGSLRANGGIIETMEVRLPNDEGMSISNVEMNGNIFTCKIGDEKYSGMIFTTDNKSFMVSFTEGNMEGTRFKFDVTTPVVEEVQPEVVAEQQQPLPQDQGGFEQPPVDNGQAQAQPQAPRVDVNPQDPSYANQNQNMNEEGQELQQPLPAQQQAQAPINGEESAQLSAEQVEETTQTQGFNFSQEQAM